MARKPKIQPGTEPDAAKSAAELVGADELPNPTRRGRKPKQSDLQAIGSTDQIEGVAGSDAGRPDADPGAPVVDAAPPAPEAKAASPAKPAAQWDRASDRVHFDWPEIERTAAQDGPNQGMAKLLIAARAEGADSRWPL
jgi:hypothetical protein